MKIVQLNSTEKRVTQTNHSLSSYLYNLSKGRAATPHSWLYENESSDTTLKRWLPIMRHANEKSSVGKEFNHFDEQQIIKFGPQGVVPAMFTPETLEVLDPMYTPSAYDNELALSAYFLEAHRFACELFGTARLNTKRPLSFDSVVDDMRVRDTLNTNSGWPRFTRRDRVRDKEIQDAQSGVAYEYPAILLFRQYNGKLRPVWMYPMSLNLLEFTFSQVIQQVIRESKTVWVRNYVSPWEGFNTVKRTVTSQWWGYKGFQVDSGDTTKMDAHMRAAQIRLVYEIVKWLFQEKYWNQLYNVMMQVCSIQLIVGKDKKIVGPHGLASGSGWTQLVETILQMFMAWLRNLKGQGIGDDFYWLCDWTASELVQYLAKFGLPANEQKQEIGVQRLYFLQRLFRKGFRSRESEYVAGAYYPTIRALNSSLNPEKFHNPKDWNSDMFCLRQFMILENCVDDPCFDEFVKFIAYGQKDLIPFAKKSASQLDDIQQAGRQIAGLNPSYNQEKRDVPLSSFMSIQLMKRL